MPALEKKYSFSIIIPCFNEKKYISQCLDSILDQNYDIKLVEIVIVDGQSDDGTLEIIKQYQTIHSNIYLFTNPNKKTPVSLNIGIKNSKNEIIVILGAHSCLDSDFLFFNNKYLAEKNVSVTGGTQINRGLNYIQQAIGLSMQIPFAMASATYRWSKKEKFVDTVVYAAYKRHLFEEVGLFDEHNIISEDAELNWRIRQAGYKIFFSPKIITYYYPRNSVLLFIKQMFKYGILRVNVLKKHLDSIKLVHIIPPIFVFALSILLILTVLGSIHQNILYYFLSFYFLVNILISAISLSINNIKYLLVVPLLTFVMHYFWGLGFIYGFFSTGSK